MKLMSKLTKRTATALAAGVAAAVLSGAAWGAEEFTREQTAAMQQFGTKIFGIKWSGRVRGGRERGVAAVTDGTTTLTSHGDRIFIVHNKKATAAPESAAFAGSDEELKERGTQILAGLAIDRREMKEVKVLQQMTQTAQREPRGKAKVGPVRKGRRTLVVTRQIGELAVPASRMLLNLDAKGNIAFMELAWPEIAPQVLESARALQAVVAGKTARIPVMERASVESVQVVILHSPAVAFYDDQVAAIRIIYHGESNYGKKPVRYVDAEGRDVPLPRQIDLPHEERVKR